MSFLAAWALAALALVVVPLAIHFRRRRAGRRVAFPAVRYLREAGEATARFARTRDVLLLAVRVALLAALAGAAAGPLVGRGGAADHEPSDVAIVLDNSGSTSRVSGDGSLLERLVARAGLTLAAGQAADRFWILPAVGPPIAASATAARATEALARVEQTDGAGDLRAIVERAAAWLPRDPDRHAEVQLLSDWQRTSFAPTGPAEAAAVPEPAEESSRSPVSGLSVSVYDPGELQVENAAVRSLSLSQGTTAAAGIRQTILFELWSSAADGSDSVDVPVRLRVDGRTAGAARARPGRPGAVRLPELSPGPHHGGLEIEPKGLRADDTRHFALATPPARTVLHAGATVSFVRIGLETLRGAGRVGRVASLESRGRSGSVAIVENARGVRASDVGSAAVLLPPADPVELPAFNELLRALRLEWRARPDTLSGEVTLESGAGSFPGMADERVLWRYRLAGVANEDSVLLATHDGEPWAVHRRLGDGNFVLLASPLIPAATTVPASPAMLPLLDNLLRAAAADSWPVADFEAGRTVPLPPWADSVRGAGDAFRSVEGGSAYTPLRAGVYEVRGGGFRAFFAANVPAPESDLSPLSPEELEELFPGADVTTAGPGERAWRSAIYRDRRGVDITPWLVLTAVLLALAESGLATSRRTVRKRRPSI